MTDSPVAIVQGLYDAFRRGDIPGLVGAFAPAIEWREADGGPYAAGNPYVGADAILQRVLGPIAGEWQDFSARPDDFVGSGETVVVIGTYGGRHAATGRALQARFAHIWRVRDGKVVNFEQITDNKKWLDAARQTGAGV